MTCFGYSSIKIDKYSNSTAIDRGKLSLFLSEFNGNNKFLRFLRGSRAQARALVHFELISLFAEL